MASKRYTVRKRREREGKTIYRRRIKLVSSHLPRLVIRSSLNNMFVQIVSYSPRGDKVLVSVSGKQLRLLGWEYSCGNIPAAYLIGLMIGVSAKNAGVTKAIVDTGILPVVKKSRIFAVVKGCVDAGINIPCSEDSYPSEERCLGRDIEEYARGLLARDKLIYQKQYSRCLSKNVNIEGITEKTRKLREEILQKWKKSSQK